MKLSKNYSWSEEEGFVLLDSKTSANKTTVIAQTGLGM
jgi:hypothetical protein